MCERLAGDGTWAFCFEPQCHIDNKQWIKMVNLGQLLLSAYGLPNFCTHFCSVLTFVLFKF